MENTPQNTPAPAVTPQQPTQQQQAPPAPTPPANTGITQDQLHNAIEKARLEEREKLRTQLDTANGKITDLTTQLEAEKASRQKIADDLTAIKASLKPDGQVDVEKAIEQAVQATASRINENWSSKFSQLQEELTQEKSTRQKLTLEQRRAQLINEAGGDKVLIPELVIGSNEDELKASIERSKAAYQRIVTTVGSPAPTTQQPQTGYSGAGSVPQSLPLPPAAGAGNPGSQPAIPSARSLSLAEYAKNRQQLKKQVSGRYADSILTQ